MHKTILTTPIMAILLFSCTENNGKKALQKKETEKLEIEMNGLYQAKLLPLNKSLSPKLNGSLTLVRENDEFIADVRLSGGPKRVLHAQGIHLGERCPDSRDDLNGDGFIDAEEGSLVYKEILIPLDDDLSSQRMGLGIYPVTDEYGYYFWSRNISFTKMLSDLREEDINLTDDYAKLDGNKSLSAVNKVVIIKGVSSTEPLPSSVAGRGRQGPHEGLPIACGVIKKLTHVPGKIDNDSTGIPVPGGETIGGSSGEDDGAIFNRGSTTGGNYGEDDELETTNNSTEFGHTNRDASL